MITEGHNARLQILVLIFLAIASSLTLAAGSDDGFRFWATVESVETKGDTVTITAKVLDFPVRILVNDWTHIRSASGETLAADEIPIGSLIEIEADLSEDGFVAKTISPGYREHRGTRGLWVQF